MVEWHLISKCSVFDLVTYQSAAPRMSRPSILLAQFPAPEECFWLPLKPGRTIPLFRYASAWFCFLGSYINLDPLLFLLHDLVASWSSVERFPNLVLCNVTNVNLQESCSWLTIGMFQDQIWKKLLQQVILHFVATFKICSCLGNKWNCRQNSSKIPIFATIIDILLFPEKIQSLE